MAVSPQLQVVLDYVNSKPEGVERSDTARKLGITYFAARYRLERLAELGLIRKEVVWITLRWIRKVWYYALVEKWVQFLASVYAKYKEIPKAYTWKGRVKRHETVAERVFEARGLFVAPHRDYEKALDSACDSILLPWLLDFVERIGFPLDRVESGVTEGFVTYLGTPYELTNGGRILIQHPEERDENKRITWRMLTGPEAEALEEISLQEIWDLQYNRHIREEDRAITLHGYWYKKTRDALITEYLG